MKDPFSTKTDTIFEGRALTYFSLASLAKKLDTPIDRLPFSIKILLEAVLRQFDGYQITEADIQRLAQWQPHQDLRHEIPFKPARVVLQDFTGVPAVVDLAALRSSLERMGHDPHQINPLVPVDLVVDHSVQVDHFGQASSLQFNIDREFERNLERYRLLNWAQRSFKNFRVVPPGTGIVHQVNLEYLASVVATHQDAVGRDVVFFDSVVGTDSHTTMVNGLGVLGWGVGGIEAEANMLGQPLYFVTPEVVGVRLTGTLPVGATATDLALTVTQLLRKKGVVGKFVEFYGPGVSKMSLADRATVANMAPEYGATMGFFPVDAETLRYLRQTARSEEHVRLVEWYCKDQGLFRTDHGPEPEFSDTVALDLNTVEPSLAGPKRPQDRVPLSLMQQTFEASLRAPVADRGFGLDAKALTRSATVTMEKTATLRQGAVVIAAITSCTNTSNPSVMIGAGLMAKKAVALGLKPEPYVKTSLAPGSRVVTAYLQKAGLLEPLAQIGFNVVGYGCTTCIGNSGPLPEAVSSAISEADLTVAAVLSGNRNFEGRIHPLVKANYLASPPLVVAYALAGTVDIDLATDPIGTDHSGQPVYLKDLWPTAEEVQTTMTASLTRDLFSHEYATVFTDNKLWNELPVPQGELYQWDTASTYIQEPPFFQESHGPSNTTSIDQGRILLLLGDSVTTDHISPAGSIASTSPAANYLREHGIEPKDFNSYGARRGNHEVMMRGTFANIRIRNQMLADGKEGGYSIHYPDKALDSVYATAMHYQADNVPLVIMAGKEYGTGSSRDWAAKGTALLGVKAVIAESFERIHRSNLVGMGVLPLQFIEGDGWRQHDVHGDELVDIEVPKDIQPGQEITVTLTRPDGKSDRFGVLARLDTPIDVDYYHNGGILQTVLSGMA